MRGVSLFSGIGGFDIAAEWAGITVVGQVENNPFCQAVLAKHWPQVARYARVQEVQGDEFGDIDILFGGFPCQPHSLAGKRGGTADDRDLWPEFFRLIRATHPGWVVGENVPGILSTDSGRFFGTILRDLATVGYTVGWLVCAAHEVGAPHRRERLFIVAHADGAGLQSQSSRPATGPLADAATSRHGSPDAALLADTTCQRSGGTDPPPHPLATRGAAWQIPECRDWATGARATESGLGRAIDGIPGWLAGRWPVGPDQAQAAWEAPRAISGLTDNRAKKLMALGNAVVPHQAYPIFAAITAWEEYHDGEAPCTAPPV